MTRKEAFENAIKPLMAQIRDLCIKHEIPYVSAHQIGMPSHHGDAVEVNVCANIIAGTCVSLRLAEEELSSPDEPHDVDMREEDPSDVANRAREAAEDKRRMS